MTHFIKLFLPLYFILFFGISFFGISLLIFKKIGKNPNVLPNDNTPYGLVGRYFKIILVLIFLYVIFLFFCSLEIQNKYLKIIDYQLFIVQLCGILLMVFSLIWVLIAQNNMKNSWRIGIDKNEKTELITSGLFNYSRNPIFLGMTISLVGLFLITLDFISLIFLILGYVLIQIQIRLEEEFLELTHGDLYIEYKSRVRRMI